LIHFYKRKSHVVNAGVIEIKTTPGSISPW